MNAYLNQYQNNQVMTASPEQVLVMLYDGAIRFVRQAIKGIEAHDLKVKQRGITDALNIVTEFRQTLDHKVGGSIAAELDALYEYICRELVNANGQNSTEPLKIVEGLLVGLRQTWAKAIQLNRAQKATEIEGVADSQPLRATL